MRIDTVVCDLPDLRAVICRGNRRYLHVCSRHVGRVEEFRCWEHVWGHDDVLQAWCSRDHLDAESGLHSAELIEARRVHLVVDGFRFEWNGQLRPCSTCRSFQCVKGEWVAALLVDACIPIALIGGIW